MPDRRQTAVKSTMALNLCGEQPKLETSTLKAQGFKSTRVASATVLYSKFVPHQISKLFVFLFHNSLRIDLITLSGSTYS